MTRWEVKAGLAALLLPAIAAAQTVPPGPAQTYPAKPIRLIVPGPAGGNPDVVARILQPGLTQALGQQLIVDNRAGAGGMIGTELAAKAIPDGYTLLWGGPGSLTILPHFHKHVTFDPLTDLAPISLVLKNPMLLLSNPTVPVKSVRDLIALAKRQPDKLNYASFGVGNVNHLSMERFKSMAGVKITHVAFTGSPPAQTALMSGYVDLMIASPPPVIDFIRAGRLRALGITSATRSTLMPDVPTIAEAGVPGYESGVWYTLLAPGKTPRAIITRLNDVLLKAVHSPKIRPQLETQGAEPAGSSPEEAAAFIRTESEKNARLVKQAGLKVE